MNRNFKKVEIATMISFTCASYLSSFNHVHAAQTLSEACASDKNIITTQKVDVRKNNANNQTKTQSGIYFDNEELYSHNHKTIAGMANYLNKENALGIASTFHIFAKNTTLNVDTNGSVATDNLNSNVDFGTRGSDTKENSKINNSQCDINYINHIGNIKPNSFRNKHNKVIMGSDINVSTSKDKRIVFNQKDGKSFYVEQSNLNLDEIKTESQNNKYIDISSELDELSKKSDYWMDTNSQNSKGVKTYLEDENNRTIDLTDAEINKDNFIFVTIDANLLKNRPINIKGLGIKKDNKIPTVVINVKNTDKDLNIGTETKLYYRNLSQPLPNSESHLEQNQLLWNFGTRIESLSFNSGRFMGSILAPNTRIFGNVNIDGNIIGKEVSISGGESHRWDLVSIANNSGQNQYPGDFTEDSTSSENNDDSKNDNKEAIPNNAPSYDLPELELKEDKPHNAPSYDLPEFELEEDKPHNAPSYDLPELELKEDKPHNAPSYDLPELDIKEDKPHNAPSYDLPEFEIKENEAHNFSNSDHSEINAKENTDSNNEEINNSLVPPLDSSDPTKETENLKSQANPTDDFIFYPPLAKHGQDIDEAHILENKTPKNKIFRTKDNPKLIHSDIKNAHYLPISKINKESSLIKKSSNNSLKNTNYISSRVIEQLPATSEKKINILSWMGIMISSGLSYLGSRKNRYY